MASIRDQIFISIEDAYFSTPYAHQKIIKEIWFYENEYSKDVISTIRGLYEHQTTAEDVSRIFAALKALDGDPRGKSLLGIIKSE